MLRSRMLRWQSKLLQLRRSATDDRNRWRRPILSLLLSEPECSTATMHCVCTATLVYQHRTDIESEDVTVKDVAKAECSLSGSVSVIFHSKLYQSWSFIPGSMMRGSSDRQMPHKLPTSSAATKHTVLFTMLQSFHTAHGEWSFCLLLQ